MNEEIDPLRCLEWATAWADSCERRFGAQLCPGCVYQGRARCALADYAGRLIANRYGGTRVGVQERGTRTGDR